MEGFREGVQRCPVLTVYSVSECRAPTASVCCDLHEGWTECTWTACLLLAAHHAFRRTLQWEHICVLLPVCKRYRWRAVCGSGAQYFRTHVCCTKHLFEAHRTCLKHGRCLYEAPSVRPENSTPGPSRPVERRVCELSGRYRSTGPSARVNIRKWLQARNIGTPHSGFRGKVAVGY